MPQQFVLQALVEIPVRHGRQRAKEQIAGSRDNRIDPADFFEESFDARLRGDIHLKIALSATYANDLMLTAQFFGDGAPDGTAGTNNDDFHG